MRKTVVINAVGLTQRLISAAHTPRIHAFVQAGRIASVNPVIPAVTCSVQSTYLTGTWPSEHGIVGNGWYDRDDCEIKFWKQSDKLVQKPRVWDIAKSRDASFTCANICWWYAMYSNGDYTVTPRPMYLADGRKIPDCWTHPPELRRDLQDKLGQFPLFRFWGPMTSIESTRWIAEASLYVDQRFHPTLSLVYLPHLDYCAQRLGTAPHTDLAELDQVVGTLIDHFEKSKTQIILLSEYGIAPVSRPIHLNRLLWDANLLKTRVDRGGSHLDAGASAAFAVADHQIAHVYINDVSRTSEIRALLEKTPGVVRVLDNAGKREMHLDHPRAGDLICLAEPDAWFTYYYWFSDLLAPDFARTVDIHRKPGYDPVELFTNASKFKIASKILKRKLGFRTLLDVIPLDATLVKGSHGVAPRDPLDGAMIASNESALLPQSTLEPTDVRDLILSHVFSD